MSRAKESDARLSVPVSAETKERVEEIAARYGVPPAQVSSRWMATMPATFQPFAAMKRGRK